MLPFLSGCATGPCPQLAERCGSVLSRRGCGNDETVNHPKHYQHASGIECWQPSAYMPHPLASALEYVRRYENKNGAKVEKGAVVAAVLGRRWKPSTAIASVAKAARALFSMKYMRENLLHVNAQC